jgi:hypothetical protein
MTLSGKSTKIDPLTPALFKAKFVWRIGFKASGFYTNISEARILIFLLI